MKGQIAACALLTTALAGAAWPQTMELGGAPASTFSAGQGPYYGAVPSGTASAEPLPLSLAGAIARGLRSNLGALLADQSTRTARGDHSLALSQLLPNVSAHTTEISEQSNLAAYGFPSFPGVPQIVGPFNVFDVRGTISQTLFNLRSFDHARASSENIKSAEFAYKDARDAVVLVVTGLYLQAISGASRIDAVEAQVATAQALYSQAVDYKKTGIVPAIDVLRAQVELQAQRQRLIAYQNEYEKQKLRLARAIGLPDGQQIRLTDQVPYTASPVPDLDSAMRRAYQSRMDYQSLLARVKAAELTRKAAVAGHLPTLSFNGDYGSIGASPVSSHGTYTADVTLNIPIFEGGRVRGELLQADAELRRQREQLDDLHARIGYEIRSAMLDLKSAGDQVEATRSATGLARQEESQARDRFAAGVTNNLEVVQAQEALAAANESYIASLYAYNLAKASLARAMGGIEKTIPSLLLGEK